MTRSSKRQTFDEITSNLGDRERGKRSIYVCNICDVLICRNGPCWAAYHNIVE